VTEPTCPTICPTCRHRTLCPCAVEPLTWDELVAECSRTAGHGNEHMLDVVITPPNSARGQEATVVPTRMHEPGFYVRSVNGTPNWASWMMRADEDLAMFKRFVGLGLVRRLEQAP
jgi:hypothetical protein